MVGNDLSGEALRAIRQRTTLEPARKRKRIAAAMPVCRVMANQLARHRAVVF
jgi:hypothetical protein